MSNLAREAEIRDKIAAQLSSADYCKTEYRIPLNSTGGHRRRSRSMDVYVEHNSVKYIIEVKHAKVYKHAIGQLVCYQALHCKGCKLVLVMYGTPYELSQYEPECRSVLAFTEQQYGLKIVLMTEVG